MEPTIVHVDLPRFQASIESAIEPTLKTKAFAVVPHSFSRASIVDMSLEAWRDGVRKGMRLGEAQKIIPRLRAVEAHWSAADSVTEEVRSALLAFSPFVETGSEGHFSADLSHGPHLAERLLDRVRRLEIFNCVIGAASNKLVSRVSARAYKWWEPRGDGFIRVEPGREGPFLAPLPVTLLPDLEEKETRLLDLLNIRLLGHLAALDPVDAARVLGRRGPYRIRQARGIDETPVLPSTSRPSFLSDTVLFSPDTNDMGLIRAKLFSSVDRLAEELQERGETAGRVELLLVYADFVENRRAKGLDPTLKPSPPPSPFQSATGGEGVLSLAQAFSGLLYSAFTRRIRLRSMHLRVMDLYPLSVQIPLFHDPRREKRQALESAVHAVRARFGQEAIRYGRSVAPRP